jgi:transcription elongation factor GreA
MSKSALAEIKAELERLESAERSAIAEQIKTAREFGDLKENAEYHAAKESAALLEAKIVQLQGAIRDAVIVEASDPVEDGAGYGSTVELQDEEADRKLTYTLVASHEADAGKGLLSMGSPVARALVGARVGETRTIQTPKGERHLKVRAIS